MGNNITLIFEDELTIRYQIQEMLRVEKIFDEEGINQELDAYNPLIPDGSNWKATMMIEYPDPAERAENLAKMIGIERKIKVKIADYPPIYAIADEDLDRETEQKTSSVHFLRFELTTEMIQALKQNARLNISVDHPAYQTSVDSVSPTVFQTLVSDLTSP